MRSLFFLALTAAVPFGLYGHLAGSGGAEGVWLRIAAAGVAGVLLLLFYRARSGGFGPGLAAALALDAWPAMADAVASPVAPSLFSLSGAAEFGASAFAPSILGALVAALLAGEIALRVARAEG